MPMLFVDADARGIRIYYKCFGINTYRSGDYKGVTAAQDLPNRLG